MRLDKHLHPAELLAVVVVLGSRPVRISEVLFLVVFYIYLVGKCYQRSLSVFLGHAFEFGPCVPEQSSWDVDETWLFSGVVAFVTLHG